MHHNGAATAQEQLCQSKALLSQLLSSSSLPNVTDPTALPAAQAMATSPNPLQARNQPVSLDNLSKWQELTQVYLTE